MATLCAADGDSLVYVDGCGRAFVGHFDAWRFLHLSPRSSSNPVVQVAMHVINSKPEGLKEAEGRREEERRTVLRAVNQEVRL